MNVKDAGVRLPAPADDAGALCDIVRRTEIAGAKRCAALLHTDRLPPSLARPHHVRLARQALECLLAADRAQCFELSRGRIAVVWRGQGGPEMRAARCALDHLLSGQPEAMWPGAADMLSFYDLPGEAAGLIDEVAGHGAPGPLAAGRPGMDLRLLGSLETTLAQADLSRFLRNRPVVSLATTNRSGSDQAPVLAWEERYVAIDDLADGLCPGRDLRADPWLFARLTRTLDARMLALLAAPAELAGLGPFGINLNVATILSPAFLRLDGALPMQLRGEVTLILRGADILADANDYAFARQFARARGYRLALAGTTPRLLQALDVAAAGLDLVMMPLTPGLRNGDLSWRRCVPPDVGVVLTGLRLPSEALWAREHGFRLARGVLFSR